MSIQINPKALGFTPTPSEIQIAREVWAQTPNPTVKMMLSQFSDECPICGLGARNWRLLPPIKPMGSYHIVKYQCKRCQAVFKKLEDADE
ncbi:hypothetical protein BR63_05790 [Thermanaerosceptrum fracticalcis]|uniref:Uncharacterized protein n=1 Tax=Thermanaerosceptrum fracticalcis TaxID=1712410 RepID=A0A7G6E1B6_THEFR|nr:hypothetical protein [Thermanaerosceptrum fracticalcis]QNB45870.1 hypothetical protein BR63_05790 [Thermanaerosceptrum fracticalcis]